MNQVLLAFGDCNELFGWLAPNSIDAICTDPPYGLEFMGKEWDRLDGAGIEEDAKSAGGYGANSLTNENAYAAARVRYGAQPGPAMQEWHRRWAEGALRVLKPGGYLLAFGGPRTYHRLASGIEDAGFQIRDVIQWWYGSGFPKALDVGKAIDAHLGAERERIGTYLTPDGRDYLKEPCGASPRFNGLMGEEMKSDPRRITAPATPEAASWDGWNTALKPAQEPIVVARKPPEGTIAQNVLRWGTGALNIAGCRIGDGPVKTNGWKCGGEAIYGGGEGFQAKGCQGGERAGRWPSNLILSHSEKCTDAGCAEGCPVAMLDAQSGASQSPSLPVKQGGRKSVGGILNSTGEDRNGEGIGYGDTGGASRFFPVFAGEPFLYLPKPSVAERELGLSGGRQKVNDGRQSAIDNPYQRGETQRLNIHPCLTPDSLVLAERGWKPISEVLIGERVYTEDGRFHPATDVSSHPYHGPIYEIAVAGTNLTTKATNNHPFIVFRPRKQGAEIVGHSIFWAQAEEVRVGDYLMTPEYDAAGAIPEGYPNDAEFWFVAGLWLAEGCFQKSGHGKNRYPVWVLHADETDLIGRIAALWPDRVSVYRKREGRSVTVMAFAPEFADQVEALCGSGAREKRIASCIFDLPTNLREAFLDGYLAGDGSRVRNVRVAKTASRSLASLLPLLAESLGYHVTVHFFRDEAEKQIGGRRFRGVGYYQITLAHRNGEIQDRKPSKPTRIDRKGHAFTLRRVKAITTTDYHGPVWNLSVQDSPTFQTVVGMSHNTVKPVGIMRWLVRLVTPKGGVCLDPFMGSGTTGIACQWEGVRFIGWDREEPYCWIAKRRIWAWKQLGAPRPPKRAVTAPAHGNATLEF